MSTASTATESVRAARKNHRCSWCGERIAQGQSYSRWRYFDTQADAPMTIRMHPECLDAFCESDEFEFGLYENARGCDCGGYAHCERCADRAAATQPAASEGPPCAS